MDVQFKEKLPISQLVSIIILAILILTTFMRSSLFIYPSLSSLYILLIAGSFIIGFSGLLLLLDLKSKVNLSPQILLLPGFAVYVTFQSLLFSQDFNHRHDYIIVVCLLIFALNIIFQRVNINNEHIFILISVAAMVESILCILQFLHFFKSHSPFFNVTGTSENPNITAMFLAMSIPAIANLYYSKSIYLKKSSLWLVFIEDIGKE